MTDCIIWEGYKAQNGYGFLVIEGKTVRAHKHLYEQAHGPVPAGLVLDHICHTQAVKAGKCAGGFECAHRLCVNLEHLEVVTQSENVRRGLQSVDVKATCPKGHSYRDEKNIMTRANGNRECAECNRIRARAVWANRKQKVSA